MQKTFWILLLLILVPSLSRAQELSPIDTKKYTQEELSMIRSALKIQAEHPNTAKGTPLKTGNLGKGLEIAVLNIEKATSGAASSAAASSAAASSAASSSAAASSGKGSSYSWVHQGSLAQGESLFSDQDDYILTLIGKKTSDFNAMVSLFKQHGFTIDASVSNFMGMNMYEASDNSHKRCAVILQKDGRLMVTIEKE